jgi:hypothetical protein
MLNIKTSIGAAITLGALCALLTCLTTGTARGGQGAGIESPTRPGPTRIAAPAAPAIDPRALTAVARSETSDFGAAMASTQTLYTVPAKKRLVVENVSCMATTAPGIHLSSSLGSRLGPNNCSTQAVFELVGSTETYRRFAFNQNVRIYAEAGTNLTFTILRSGASSQGGYTIGFSGYLVDVP